MKALSAGMLLAVGLVVVLVYGCNQKKEEPVVMQAPAQQPVPRAYPEDQVPKAEPQPAPEPITEAPTPPPVDRSVNAPEEKAPKARPKATPKEHYAPERKAVRHYTVKKGDTLQKISEKYYGTTRNWRKIYQANKKVLRDPDKLVEGTRLVIP